LTPIRRLDHVGIATADTEAALTFFRDELGLEVAVSEVNEKVGARLTYLDLGNAWLQLVEPLREDMPVAEHLREHGEGLHHICFGVEDVERDAAAMGDGSAVRMGSGRGRPSAFLPGEVRHGTRIECTLFDYGNDVLEGTGWLDG
jgi:methylmalonyl-CoA/ethylmalonyl-CoA epimerase